MRALAGQRADPHRLQSRPAADHSGRHAFPYDNVREMGKLGLFGLPFPEEYGGMGGDYLALCLVLEELARVDSSVAITLEAGVSLGAMPLYLFGAPEQKTTWLPRLCAGEILGAFGLTEPGGGSDAGATRTTARLDEATNEWVINGSKCFITNAGTDITALITITAVTGTTASGGKEISAIIVPSGTPGLTVAAPYSKVGWNASDTRELSFDDVRVPAENLLGPFKKEAALAKLLSSSRGGTAREYRPGPSRPGDTTRPARKPLLRTLRCDSVAPLGTPVVPDVYWMLIGSSGLNAALASASSR